MQQCIDPLSKVLLLSGLCTAGPSVSETENKAELIVVNTRRTIGRGLGAPAFHSEILPLSFV